MPGDDVQLHRNTLIVLGQATCGLTMKTSRRQENKIEFKSKHTHPSMILINNFEITINYKLRKIHCAQKS